MANIFKLSTEDKEYFIQALHSIFNLDRNYPDDEREFIYQLKVLMGLRDFRPYTLDDEEKDLAKIIESIKNKDLVYYLFLIAKEAEKKQTDKALYKLKIRNVIKRLNTELQQTAETIFENKDLINSFEDLAQKVKGMIEEKSKKVKNLFGKSFHKDEK